MKRSKSGRGVRRVRVSADGAGVVSHAGAGMLREVADLSGLIENVTAVLADTYKGPWLHDPGRVFADLAVAVADGADCVSGIGTLVDQQRLHGMVASLTTTWRLLDQRLDLAHLPGVKAARAAARAAAWAAGAAPQAGQPLVLDVDASISLDHSDNKENAAATWKRTYGFHTLLVFADRTEIASGEAMAGKLRPGNAGSNTTCDHIEVLTEALASIPENFRPRPADPTSPSVLIRSDSAGATYGFAEFCRQVGVGFSFGFAVREPVRDALGLLNDAAWLACLDGIDVWYPTINADGSIRDGAWVGEATDLLDLSDWPAGSRVILRKERPHPGAQLTFTDVDGHRITAFITDTPPRVVPGQLGRIGPAAPATRPGRGPDPAGQGDRDAELPVPPLRSQQCVARDRDDSDGPRCLVQTHRLHRRTGPRHMRDRDVPLPGAARRGPAQQQRPANQTPDRPDLAVGRADHPRLAPDPYRVHLTPVTHRPHDPKP